MLPNVAKYTLADSILVVNTDKMIPLKKFAEANQIGYRTAYRHWQNGLLEGVKLPTGTILVKGWNTQKDISDNSECIIFIRESENKNNEILNNLKSIANSNGMIIKDIIVWNGYYFEDNPFIDKILNSQVKNIITTSYSDIYGINWKNYLPLLDKIGISTITTNESLDIGNNIKGLIKSSSRMAKASVGMHSFKKEIAHYINNLLN